MARRRRLQLGDRSPDGAGLRPEPPSTSGGPPGEEPTLEFRLLRPRDLVALDVRCYRCALVEGEGKRPAEIIRDEEGAWLEVLFRFQHVGERAYYQVRGDVPKVPLAQAPKGSQADALQGPPKREKDSGSSGQEGLDGDDPPTAARAANGSRLCFDVPEDEAIEFTIEGVLAALSRLPLRVSPGAAPWSPRQPERDFRALVLTEVPGAVLTLGEQGPQLLSEGQAKRRGLAVTPLRQKPKGARGLLSAAGDLRLLRAAVTNEATVGSDRVEIAQGVGQEIVAAPTIGRLVAAETRAKPPADKRLPRPPAADQTAIEAPYRLILSPSSLGGFAHATRPVAAESDASRVELWHSRLGVRAEDPATGRVSVDERESEQRIVRAIWGRDLDPRDELNLYRAMGDEGARNAPFRMSLDARDRAILVRQTADPTVIAPRPVDARRLHLSALGAWLDLHAEWNAKEIEAYAKDAPSILAWDHVAPEGRDQYVRVVYPGYLFPFGHACALVKVTERKVADAGEFPQARLYQRKFLVAGEPVRNYDSRDLPFKRVALRPLVTPDLDDPEPSGPAEKRASEAVANAFDSVGIKLILGLEGDPGGAAGIMPGDLFWPVVEGRKFRFTLDCVDHAGDSVQLRAPLLFVAAHLGEDDQKATIEGMYRTDATVEGEAQQVSLAAPEVPGDTAIEAASFSFAGTPGDPGKLTSTPRMEAVTGVVPAMRRLLSSQAPASTFAYDKGYVDNDFAGAGKGDVFARALDEENPAKVLYENTAEAGGLIAPNFPVGGLSRTLGPVGDVASIAKGEFQPEQFFASLGDDLPKLFGVVDLTDLLDEVSDSLDAAPRFLTEALDTATGLIADLSRLVASLEAAVERVKGSAEAELKAFERRLDGIREQAEEAVDEVLEGVAKLQEIGEETESGILDAPLKAVEKQLDELGKLLDEAPLPPAVRAELERLLAALEPLLAGGARVAETIERVAEMAAGLAAGNPSLRARYEWRPRLKNWPAEDPILAFDSPETALRLSVEARASAGGDAGLDAAAELGPFEIRLVPPDFHIVTLRFERVAFRGGSDRKPQVDVLFEDIRFEGILSFVNTLSEVIPFDGLSDPPYVTVDAAGARAGFDLGLPNLSVGAFSLENINLGLEARVPFIGKGEAVTVGFDFCTRERPFALTVMAFGGGGYFGLRASPTGIEMLEGALEFGARVSVDFGVASGSIEAMGGIYYRMEEGKTTLTGYFRLRGEVELLAIASVSLTAELSLTYREKEGGKSEMYGQARVTLEVELLFIEVSASFTIKRSFAGAAGDPILAEALDLNAKGESRAWSDYCLAFAGD